MPGNRHSGSGRRLAIDIILILVLIISLAATSAALTMVSVAAEDQYFATGQIKINLNDGKPVIEEHEFLFEPGMTVKKDFFIQNESTWEVYYRLYFADVQGGLADSLQIAIYNGSELLYYGTATELSQQNVLAAEDTLRLHERRELTIWFHMPEETGNGAQDQTLSFTLCAEAVQTKNNPDKLFN